MNIHGITSELGSLHNSLGPVTVKKVYAVSGSGNGARLDTVIEDDSGETKLKLWGASSSTSLREGDQILIRSNGGPKDGLKASEYQGNISISANGCKVEFVNGGGSSQPAQQSGGRSGGYTRPRPGSGQGSRAADPNEKFLTKKELAQEVCELAADILEAGNNLNLPDEVVYALAGKAHEVGSLHWFGKRWIGDGKG